MKKNRIFTTNFWVGLPSFVWLVIFYALPVIIVFLLAFRTSDLQEVGPSSVVHQTMLFCLEVDLPIHPPELVLMKRILKQSAVT